MNVSVGDYVCFTCKSWGKKKWFWTSPNETIHSLDSTVLSIYPVRTKDTGYYHCFGSYKGNTKHFIATGHLKVYGESIYCLNNFVGLYKMHTQHSSFNVGTNIDKNTEVP